MQLSYFYTFVISFIACFTAYTVAADTDTATDTATTPTTTSATLIYVTVTNAAGGIVVTQSPFSQKFSSFWTTVGVPKAGTIGLGTVTLTENIGKVRTYPTTTIKRN